MGKYITYIHYGDITRTNHNILKLYMKNSPYKREKIPDVVEREHIFVCNNPSSAHVLRQISVASKRHVQLLRHTVSANPFHKGAPSPPESSREIATTNWIMEIGTYSNTAFLAFDLSQHRLKPGVESIPPGK